MQPWAHLLVMLCIHTLTITCTTVYGVPCAHCLTRTKQADVRGRRHQSTPSSWNREGQYVLCLVIANQHHCNKYFHMTGREDCQYMLSLF